MAATSEETIALLQSVPVFSTLADEDLVQVAAVTVPCSFASGEVVFREGDRSDTCYVVRSGRVRAIREHTDGRTITLATFAAGDFFGELAMFEDELRSATVEAIEPTSVVAVLGPDMRRLMTEHPEISMRLVVALAGRLRETNERLSRQSFQTVQSRVAVVLSALVAQELAEEREQKIPTERRKAERRSAGRVSAGETQNPPRSAAPPEEELPRGDVLITATQNDLAQLAGSSRESASRFLAVLERAGVISQGRGRLVVHDLQALKQYVF